MGSTRRSLCRCPWSGRRLDTSRPSRPRWLSCAGTCLIMSDRAVPTIVLLHGLMMDASLWDGPIADLGAHRHAMHADADLSLPGIARLVAEFLDRLDLHRQDEVEAVHVDSP